MTKFTGKERSLGQHEVPKRIRVCVQKVDFCPIVFLAEYLGDSKLFMNLLAVVIHIQGFYSEMNVVATV